MLSRFLCKPSNLRFVALISSPSQSSEYNHYRAPPIQSPSSSSTFFSIPWRYFSSSGGNNSSGGGKSPDIWNFSSENEEGIESVFGEDAGSMEGFVAGEGRVVAPEEGKGESWLIGGSKEKGAGNDEEHDIFAGIESESKEIRADDDWAAGEGLKAWNFVVGDQMDGKETEEIFDIGISGESELIGLHGDERVESKKSEEERELEIEEKALSEVLKGKNRAFGDLIAASGITDEMLDSLMALKDLDDVPGLPPLSEIERMRYEKNTRKSTRADLERQKQEEIAKQQVRKVDSNGRAYGTGKRKCSIARVWIQPGDGKFIVNNKQFDAYFPILDHRAALLRPFSETKTLGLMDVNCTVKGGGLSGQVGAIRLGISRALQNWAPEEFRPPLKEAGFLTRDSRIVERKKPGKAKARKSFQWVKR